MWRGTDGRTRRAARHSRALAACSARAVGPAGDSGSGVNWPPVIGHARLSIPYLTYESRLVVSPASRRAPPGLAPSLQTARGSRLVLLPLVAVYRPYRALVDLHDASDPRSIWIPSNSGLGTSAAMPFTRARLCGRSRLAPRSRWRFPEFPAPRMDRSIMTAPRQSRPSSRTTRKGRKRAFPLARSTGTESEQTRTTSIHSVSVTPRQVKGPRLVPCLLRDSSWCLFYTDPF